MSKKLKIILIGGGGHCKACIDVIEQMNEFEIAGIIDIPGKKGNKILGYSVIGTDADIQFFSKKGYYFHITLGQIETPQKRILLYNTLKKHYGILPTIISPNAYISKYAVIEEGTIVMHHAVINAGAKIGKNCIVNTKALVEHDAMVGDNCHISTGSIVNGGVKIGKNTFYGSGAITKQYTEIPKNSFIKANSISK